MTELDEVTVGAHVRWWWQALEAIAERLEANHAAEPEGRRRLATRHQALVLEWSLLLEGSCLAPIAISAYDLAWLRTAVSEARRMLSVDPWTCDSNAWAIALRAAQSALLDERNHREPLELHQRPLQHETESRQDRHA
jgi:hypothetical protein